MSYKFTTLITGVSGVDELKDKIKSANLKFKEDDDLLLLYSETNLRTDDELDNSVKSVIIDKHTLKPITTQFNKLIYNDDALTFLSDKPWEKISVKYCYEGTMILVFYMYNKWYVCTRKCLDAKTSFWIKNCSYYDLFMDAIKDKFTFDDLDTKFCYHFILLHHKNKNIVDYREFGREYKNVAHAMTTELETFKKIKHVINDKIIYPAEFSYTSLQETLKHLDELSQRDKEKKCVTIEGYIVEYVNDGVITLLKLQTNLYKYISEIKPNVSNLDAMFLELYQKDKLIEIIPYFSINGRDVVKRIHSAVCCVCDEILHIYHCTRNHSNPELYSILSASYKGLLYSIHGVYLSKYKRELKNKETPVTTSTTVETQSEQMLKSVRAQARKELGESKSISIHDVYECVKNAESYRLKQLFIDRLKLFEHTYAREFLCYDCDDAFIQGKLMA